MNPHDSDKLEKSIHRVLRNLPDRKAPAGLMARVQAELARRSALPWWKKSFAHWPSAVRAGFFAGTGLAAALIVAGLFVVGQSSGAHQIAGGISASYAWVAIVRDVVSVAADKVKAFLSTIPPYWLYGGAATIALCYAAIAALGATAYRALSLGRQAS